jgi:hypothetical protein
MSFELEAIYREFEPPQALILAERLLNGLTGFGTENNMHAALDEVRELLAVAGRDIAAEIRGYRQHPAARRLVGRLARAKNQWILLAGQDEAA